MELKIRVWASNDKYPSGAMFYPEHDANPFMLNMHGDLLNANQKAAHNYDCTFARIGWNEIDKMLFTQKLDIFNKEIYINDIIQFNIPMLGKMFKGVVSFYDGSFCVIVNNMKGDLPFGAIDKITILGNIHENKELIR